MGARKPLAAGSRGTSGRSTLRPMESGRIRRLRLSLTNEHLDAAIDLLSAFHPSVLHPRGWASLTTELERRHDGELPQDIEMMSGVFQTLPSAVQGLLREHVRADARRAA